MIQVTARAFAGRLTGQFGGYYRIINVKALSSRRSPVTVTGSLFWDGEHRFPNNVGPEKLRPTKAWEIHPIKLLAER